MIPKPDVPGNLDPWNRPIWWHPGTNDVAYGTTESKSRLDEDPKSPLRGKEVIYPTIINGFKFSDDDAWQHYQNTGEHLGAFNVKDPKDNKDPAYEAADAYAQWLHEEQARRIESDPNFARPSWAMDPSLAAPFRGLIRP